MKYLIIVAVVAIIFFFFIRKKKAGSVQELPEAQADVTAVTLPADTSDLKNITEYVRTKDAKFSPPAFTEKMSNLFIRYNNAIEDKDTLTVKPYFSEEIIAGLDKSNLDDKVAGITHIIEKMTVLSASIKGWKTVGDKDDILIELRTRVTDYKVDESNNVVSGSRDEEQFLTYEWYAERPAAVVTGDGSGKKAQNCPNCGAAVNINDSAVCEYCGCVLNTDSFDWVVTDIKLVAKRV